MLRNLFIISGSFTILDFMRDDETPKRAVKYNPARMKLLKLPPDKSRVILIF